MGLRKFIHPQAAQLGGLVGALTPVALIVPVAVVLVISGMYMWILREHLIALAGHTGAALGAVRVEDAPPPTSYTVQDGDTLWDIARAHGTTVAALYLERLTQRLKLHRRRGRRWQRIP